MSIVSVEQVEPVIARILRGDAVRASFTTKGDTIASVGLRDREIDDRSRRLACALHFQAAA